MKVKVFDTNTKDVQDLVKSISEEEEDEEGKKEDEDEEKGEEEHLEKKAVDNGKSGSKYDGASPKGEKDKTVVSVKVTVVEEDKLPTDSFTKLLNDLYYVGFSHCMLYTPYTIAIAPNHHLVLSICARA